MPTKKGFLLLGLFSLLGLIAELLAPSYEQPRGRLSILFTPIWHQFGWVGIAVFWAFSSVVFLILWMKKKEK